MSTVSVFSTALVGLALFYEGEATADVDLNDSGVWVTKTSAGLLGRFNSESQALDGTLNAGSASFDVQQDAGRVLLDDAGTGTASPVSVAHLKLDGQIRLPAGAQVVSGGATTAILDGEEGLLWVLPFDGAASFDAEKLDPVAEVGGEGALTVSRDGTVFAAIPSTGTLWTVATTSKGAVEGEPSSSALPVSKGAEVDVTAVGDEPVVLDRSASHLILPGGESVAVEGGGDARLQQPSQSSDVVVVATTDALVSQPLKGGDAQRRAAQGVPAAPVQLGVCTYGAWASTGQVIRDCDGTGRDVDERLEGLDPQTRLEYRVNRQVIVLNDLSAGTLWMAADEYQKVDDWDVQMPEEAEGEESDAELTNPEQVDQFIADRTQPNKPPQPKDDSFGVRPGRTTILPVLGNDVDPDGDVMTASLAGDSPANATVQAIMGGAALQAVVPEDAQGTGTFRYAVADGRGGVAEAGVTLKVSPWGENAAPEQTGDPVLRVAQGGRASIKVLPYFKDPDGDDLYLASAAATVAGDDVRSRPDGTVEFRDGGGSTGRKIVTLLVSDGEMSFEGKLLVDVVPGPQPPVAVNDHVVVPAGQPVTVEPLRNDTDPNGDELRLASVSESAPAEITPNYDAGTFTFLSMEPRSYDLTYQVTDGPNATTGLVRVDVLPPSEAAGAPIVVTDTALLPAGGSTLVDVLANDTDPAGGVLVVQSVRVPADAGVSVAILAHQMLRVTEIRRLDAPVTVEYTASNGTETATGQVRVIPVPAPTRLQPPQAAADEVTVHAGDVVTVPVLKNDTHPDGLELFLQPELEQDVDPALGEAFVSEDTLRFKAGPEAGTAYAIYRVRDVNGQEDSAQVTIRIRDGEDNAPPQPREIQARVLSGSSVRIAVPLDGIDPDGDSVQVTGIATPAGKGTARVVDGQIEYAASKNATGHDTFTYSVLDARGATAVGTVQVGIARPAETNQPPVAVDDEITVRPGRTVSVAAVANDTDPDGDQVGLVPGGIEDTHDLDAEVVTDRIVLTSPDQDGAYTFYYQVQDTYGARATGAVTVNVAADAPLLPPVARDDTVPVEDILGKTEVTVPVLDNDDDPDGAATELTVTTDATTTTVTDTGELVVTLTETRQVVTYTVTDVDGLTAKAFVKVPGLTDQAPTLRPGITPLEVVSGEPLPIDITDYVLVVEGKTPRLTTEEKVTALEGTREVPSTTEIVYTSNAEYVGPAAVTFEVTDGSGPDDPDGHTALLTLPITVVPPENLPPELSTPTLDVAAGEEASIDLARFATDADGDPLTFKATGQAQGVTVTVEGSTLHAQATPDVPKGSVVQVPISVTDGEHPPVEGTATLTVVASTRPLARANQDTVDDAHQGKPTTVPVLANDSNPFPDTPLTVTGAVVETGSGDVAFTGDSVTVTPAESFVGVMVVVYRVQDATKDQDRLVEGRVQLKVLGKPEAPATPQVDEVRSKTVVLSWDPPNNNGADITGYTVRSQNGYEKACGTTTCTLDGLTNDVEYTFTVFATNAVGDGPASPPSEVARPDEKPDPPAAPTLEFGDKSLTVTWENKTYTDRSAIETVNLEISPAPPGGAIQMQALSGNQVVWTGLTNGVAYRVRVQAVNRAPDPSDWGDYSAEEIPAGLPDVPETPSASRASDSPLNGGSIDVAWKAPFENGDAVKAYHLQRYRNGSPDGAALTLTGLSHKATGLDNESSYTFTVTAENKAGVTAPSGQSAAVVPFGRPEAPPRPSVQNVGSGSQDSGIPRVSWGAADANGSPITAYTVTAAPGGATKQVAGTSVDFTGLPAGTYTFTVTATNAGGTSTSSQASGQARAYGKPGQPSTSASRIGENRGRFTISAPSSNGGDGISRYEWQLSGAQNSSGTGQRVDVGSDYDQTFRLQARACNAAGCSAWGNQATFTTDKRPDPPRIWASRGAPATTGSYGDCNDLSVCTKYRLNTNATFPTDTYTVQCMTNAGGYDHAITGGYTREFGPNASFDLPCIMGNYYPAPQNWISVSPAPARVEVQRNTWPNK
ncbi:Ig-like domain-containing protein [Cellulosimicrobium protaetiae]|uniref:Ig-like domain-containing protein n=2 Tax=Cellulosimicrobium TaxID=157920 RepID=UPI0020A34149|nr:Ig-like domain-containing protein [Cellulosimicrobium protaetiae]